MVKLLEGEEQKKSMLKVGHAYDKYRVKRNYWPKVRGVAVNPIEHPHGGGNHKHIGNASTIHCDAPQGKKVEFDIVYCLSLVLLLFYG